MTSQKEIYHAIQTPALFLAIKWLLRNGRFVVVAFYRAGLLIFPSTEWKALIPLPPKAQTLSLLLLYVHTLRWTRRDAAPQRENRRDAYPQSMTSRWAVAGCMSGQESSCGAQWVSFHASYILYMGNWLCRSELDIMVVEIPFLKLREFIFSISTWAGSVSAEIFLYRNLNLNWIIF